MAKLDIFRQIEKVQKGINKVAPETIIRTAPKITISNGYKGKRFNFKFAPVNILDFAEKYMKYTFLSDPQKQVLVDIWGMDPENWNTDYIEYCLLVGQGGGKNTVVEVGINYALAYLINLENVYQVFSYLCKKDIPYNMNFEITNNCVPLDSEILTKEGWKKYNEVRIGELVLTYNCDKDITEWLLLENITTTRLPVLELYNAKLSLKCSTEHKWAIKKTPYKIQSKGKRPIRGAYKNRKPDRFLCSTKDFKGGYKIIMAAPCKEGKFDITPTECAIIGWTITDGTIQRKGNSRRIGIYQSKEIYLDEIRNLLNSVDKNSYEVVTKRVEMKSPQTGKKYKAKPSYCFYLTATASRNILKKASINDNLDNIITFITSLNPQCRAAMLDAMMKAEGDGRRFAQKKRIVLDVFQILATLQGKALGKEKLRNGCYVQELKSTKSIAKEFVKKRDIGIQDVWCPTTKNGTWVMRQNGSITITGNSMVGELQAKTVFFDRIKGVLKSTIEPHTGRNIYEKYMDMDLRDEGLGDMKAKVIEFPNFNKNTGRIKLHSLDSGVSSFEGKTILVSLVDEPSRASSETTYKNAKLLYKGLIGNITTRFPNQVGKVISFSYPNTSEYDLEYELVTNELESIQKSREKGIKHKSTRKVYVFSTFQFNPSITKSSKVKDYSEDLFDAEARYECIKSRSQYAFFKPHVEKIRECILKGIQNKVNYEQIITEKKMVVGTVKNYSSLEVLQIMGDDKFRCWACDTSINKDRFVLASGFMEDYERNIDTIGNEKPAQMINNKRAIIDLMMIWSPTEKYPVDFSNVNKIIDKLLNYFPNSVFYKSDKFQSEGLAAIFEDRGIRAQTVGFSTAEQYRLYTAFRTAVFNGMVGYIEIPLLVEELERVQKVSKADKVDHPLGFSKDCADVVVQLYELLTSLEFIQFSESSGLDKFRDSKIIELCDKLIRLQNELKQSGLDKNVGYMCERLGLSENDYIKLLEAKQTFFPNN